MQAPVVVLNQNQKREHGRKAQLQNVLAGKAVAGIVRTTLGPRSMLKMILDPMGGIVLTNDGNAILREIDVSHPAAKSMIELARTQDEEVGDGTTSVIVLAGEVLTVAQPLLERGVHPRHIVAGFRKALDDALNAMSDMALDLDVAKESEILKIITATLGTKFSARFGDLMTKLALEAVLTVRRTREDGSTDIDVKRYARVEKVPGGELSESRVLNGIMINKDVTTPASMQRRFANPRIVLLDSPLEYKKGESQTNVEITADTDFNRMLELEEESVRAMCDEILRVKPDIVLTEKGVSDLAQHFLSQAGVSVIRRVRKSDNNRIARAVGAKIVHEPSFLKESDVGTGCGLFEVRKIGDEFFSFFEECADPKDAMGVARTILLEPKVLPGGGATEMAVARVLRDKADSVKGLMNEPYRAVAEALEVIPRTLMENCGGKPIRLLTALRARHAAGEVTLGVDGNQGVLVDMNSLGVWEPVTVKTQTIKTAVESAAMILRIDDIISGMSAQQQ
ncbi:MAG: hypothetical protein MHM6MM_004187 [Cercozoa sp. M6MM]